MKPSPITRYLFFVSFIIVASTAGYLASQYSSLPTYISSHFSGIDKDGFSNKRLLWLNILINSGIMGFVGYIVWHPKLFGLKVNFLEKSQVVAIKNRQLLLSVLLLIITLVLCADIVISI